MSKLLLSFNIILKDFSYFFKLLRALSIFRILVKFSLKLVYSTMYGKISHIYGVQVHRKCIESRRFYSCTPPQSKLSPKFLSSHPRQREITHSPRQHFFENLFPLTAKSDGENYDSIRKY